MLVPLLKTTIGMSAPCPFIAFGRNADNLETRIFLTAALVASGNQPTAEWEADQINAFGTRLLGAQLAEDHPMTSVRQQKGLLALLAAVNL